MSKKKTGEMRGDFPPIVEIVWYDSLGRGCWRTRKETREFHEQPLLEVRTAGFLLGETKDHVFLVHSLQENFLDEENDDVGSSVDQEMKIPKAAIVRRRVLIKGRIPWKS